MITSRKFEPEDWEMIDDAIEPFSHMDIGRDFSEIMKRSIALTCTEKGSVMACGGVTYISDDDGIIWLKVSGKCRNNRYFWARTILETFRIIKYSVGDLKLSTYILDKFCKGEKLANLIGLKRTDEFEEYNGNVYYRYTAVI